jgi:prevent-host-death family protein
MPKLEQTIGVRALKAHASAILREVKENGAEFVVTVHGRPVARIEPMSEQNEAEPIDGMGNSKGIYADLGALTWEDFKDAKKLWEPEPFSDNSA